jgi:maleylpyruvate isomerase
VTDAAAPTEWLAGCVAAHAALLADLEGLTDEQARGASLLPGWTIGHVLTHVARNADSVVRRLDGAARGELVDQYPGGLEERRADIEAGAGRPAAELVADVRLSAGAVEEVMATLPGPAWDAPSRSSGGTVVSSREVVFSRWREVVVHHGDLGLSPVSYPVALVEVWLPRELPRLVGRADPVELMAWVLGRGPAPALESW